MRGGPRIGTNPDLPGPKGGSVREREGGTRRSASEIVRDKDTGSSNERLSAGPGGGGPSKPIDHPAPIMPGLGGPAASGPLIAGIGYLDPGIPVIHLVSLDVSSRSARRGCDGLK